MAKVSVVLLLALAPAVLGARWVKKSPLADTARRLQSPKAPRFVRGVARRLDGHDKMDPEAMKAMLETQLAECETKCPGVIDGVMATMNALTGGERRLDGHEGGGDGGIGMMIGMIDAMCPHADAMKCAEENKDICTLGDDEEKAEEGAEDDEGIEKLLKACDCHTACPGFLTGLQGMMTLSAQDESKQKAWVKEECASRTFYDAVKCAKDNCAGVFDRRRRLDGHDKEDDGMDFDEILDGINGGCKLEAMGCSDFGDTSWNTCGGKFMEGGGGECHEKAVTSGGEPADEACCKHVTDMATCTGGDKCFVAMMTMESDPDDPNLPKYLKAYAGCGIPDMPADVAALEASQKSMAAPPTTPAPAVAEAAADGATPQKALLGTAAAAGLLALVAARLL